MLIIFILIACLVYLENEVSANKNEQIINKIKIIKNDTLEYDKPTYIKQIE